MGTARPRKITKSQNEQLSGKPHRKSTASLAASKSFGSTSTSVRIIMMAAALLVASVCFVLLQKEQSDAHTVDGNHEHNRSQSGSASSAEDSMTKDATGKAKAEIASALHEDEHVTPTLEDYDSCIDEMRLDQKHRVAKVYWPGFHLGCVQAPPDKDGQVNILLKNGSVILRVDLNSKYGVKGLLAQIAASVGPRMHRASRDRTVVPSVFGWEPHDWVAHSSKGWQITDLKQLRSTTGLYVFEGGAFLWPGIKIGFKRNVTLVDQKVEITTVSLRPLVLRLSGFLNAAESKYIMKITKKQLQRSGVVNMDGDDGSGQQARTSSNTGIARGASPTVLLLEKRAHMLTRLPYENGEELQVVRYAPNQKYEAHRDFFHPNDYVNQPNILNWVDCGARNRIATVFWYLNTVEGKGGETYFPRALNADGQEYKPWNHDYRDCYRGVSVKPIQGDAVLFYSMLPNGELDERSLHGGCPPEADTKWGANQWIWNQQDKISKPCVKVPEGTPLPCRDGDKRCATWAASGECEAEPEQAREVMQVLCPKSCSTCDISG